METLIGKTLGHYRILERIGAGGMGEVYLARDERLERAVALKVLPSGVLADKSLRRRFRMEALALSKLNHPNIATVHDLDSHDGVDFLVMEYVAGELLTEKLSAGRLTPSEITRLSIDLAEGLAAAHEQGVVHRDLKPANLRLTPDGRLKILDFGLAKLTHSSGDASDARTRTVAVTEAGALLGTLPYMAPEQLRGERVDTRSDLWAAGLVIYEMATGKRAFPEVDRAGLVAAILRDPVPPPSSENRDAAPALDRVVGRCLEKDASKRYQSARELALDLRLLRPELPAPTSARASRVPKKWLAITVAGLAAITVAMLAWNQGWIPGSRLRPHGTGGKDWILVADFEGPLGNQELATTARDLVSAAIDQSEIAATVPRDQVRLALEAAGKPVGTPIDAALARELAYRSSVRAVLEGKVQRLGKGYSVVLRVTDAESPRLILTETAVAKDLDGLIPVLGRLTQKLRRDLGEREAAIRVTRPMDLVATPSFEAYRLFLQAQRTHGVSPRQAIPMIRDALALDPDFAVAWRNLGICFSNLGQNDSALAAYDEALRRPQRLTTIDRLNVEALRAMSSGDLSGALGLYERILRYNPTDIAALINGGATLAMLGRFEEALASHRQAIRSIPIGSSNVLRINEVNDLFCLGRADDARVAARSLRGPPGKILPTYVELSAHNWEAAESLAAVSLHDSSLNEEQQGELLNNLGSAQAGRGALASAAKAFRRSEGNARGPASPSQNMARRARLSLALVSGGVVPLPEDTWARDRSTPTLLTRSLRAAIAGDRLGAERLWNEAQKRSHFELSQQTATPALVRALLLGLGRKWEQAARTLQPIASQRVEIGTSWYPAGISAIRWVLADAYEKLGKPDSAAIYLERVVSEAYPALQESHLRGIFWPFAHRRLVMLYARMGRIQDARRHWKIFTETLTRPDPELTPFIEQARAELAKAERAGARPIP